MALIGVFKKEELKGALCLRAVHFNLWVLPKTIRGVLSDALCFRDFGFYRYFSDVGLRLEVRGAAVSEIELHLPASTYVAQSAFDLEAVVLDEDTNDLVFGRKVQSNNNAISYTRRGIEIRDTVHGISTLCATDSPNRFRIVLKSAITSTTEPATAYIRFRYPLPQKNELISSIGWGFAKKGFTFDARLNDFREVVEYRGKNETQTMMSGDEANIFIIHPATYSITLQSPEPHYTRLLEPKVWGKYLRSCGLFKSDQKFIITQWSSSKFSHDEPFKVFAKLHKEFGMSVALVYFVGILTVPVVNGLFGLISKLF